jgi:predicted alpha/beta-fold hydrolase
LDPDFQPLFRNPHFLTIAGNFWSRRLDEKRFPAVRKTYRITDRVSVVAVAQQPEGEPKGQLVLLHGLEGSADSGYMRSFAQAALEAGFGVHRLNLRTCGGTEALSETMYHSGLTSDTIQVADRLQHEYRQPIVLVGFSLGGNVVLKLAGELGHTSSLGAVCAVSPPIDLARCVRAIGKRANLLYSRRFLNRLKHRIVRKTATSPESYSIEGLRDVKTIWDFDDRYTAPLFGFGTAENYYRTQSSHQFLRDIRVPTLIVTAKDDPLVPFDMFDHPSIKDNPALTLTAPEHGGHLGFLSRKGPRFWVEQFVLRWVDNVLHEQSGKGTHSDLVAAG